MNKKVKRYNGEDGSQVEETAPKRERVYGPKGTYKMATQYTPLAGENFVTGKVPGEPGYKPMTAEEAKMFDEKGNKIERKTIGPKDIEGYKPREYPKAPEGSITKDMLRPSGTRGGGAGMGGAGADVPGLKIGTKKKLDYAKGGKVRGCGCATKGLTKGRMV